jgi:hypothetical protein
MSDPAAEADAEMLAGPQQSAAAPATAAAADLHHAPAADAGTLVGDGANRRTQLLGLPPCSVSVHAQGF